MRALSGASRPGRPAARRRGGSWAPRGAAAAAIARSRISAFTGAGTAAVAPMRTISPLSASASIEPSPRAIDCHDEPPRRCAPWISRTWSRSTAPLGLLLGRRVGDAGRGVHVPRLAPRPPHELGGTLVTHADRLHRVPEVHQQLRVLPPHHVGHRAGVEARTDERRDQSVGPSCPRHPRRARRRTGRGSATRTPRPRPARGARPASSPPRRRRGSARRPCRSLATPFWKQHDRRAGRRHRPEVGEHRRGVLRLHRQHDQGVGVDRRRRRRSSRPAPAGSPRGRAPPA